MRRTLWMAATLAAACGSPAPPRPGSWIGDIRLGDNVDRLEVVIDSTGKAAFSLRGFGLVAAAGHPRASGRGQSRLHASGRAPTPRVSAASGDGGTWSGLATRGGDSGRFEVKRIHPLDRGGLETDRRDLPHRAGASLRHRSALGIRVAADAGGLRDRSHRSALSAVGSRLPLRLVGDRAAAPGRHGGTRGRRAPPPRGREGAGGRVQARRPGTRR